MAKNNTLETENTTEKPLQTEKQQPLSLCRSLDLWAAS